MEVALAGEDYGEEATVWGEGVFADGEAVEEHAGFRFEDGDFGVGLVSAEFGYAEFNGKCTTRQETCLANSATIGAVPFQFAGENTDGMPCAGKCTLAIPAVSQRVLYYRVKYRNGANVVVGETPEQAVIVP